MPRKRLLASHLFEGNTNTEKGKFIYDTDGSMLKQNLEVQEGKNYTDAKRFGKNLKRFASSI